MLGAVRCSSLQQQRTINVTGIVLVPWRARKSYTMKATTRKVKQLVGRTTVEMQEYHMRAGKELHPQKEELQQLIIT